jgi:peptide/nickel transport system permease protein
MFRSKPVARTAAFVNRDLRLSSDEIGKMQKRATAEWRWTGVSIWVGGGIVVAVLLMSLVGPYIGFGNPNTPHFGQVLLSPSLTHPFGTDQLGRDVLARTFAASPLDYEVGFITTFVGLVVGLVLGALAGYLGGWVDAVIMRVVDILLAFPFMIFVMAFVAIFGVGLFGIYVGLIVFSWASFARVTRAEMLSTRERQYIAAAKTMGIPTRRILRVHALPNVIRPSLVVAMATLVWNILTLAALSYLGLGVQPPTPEWGSIVASGQSIMLSAWWVATLPGLVIVLVGMGFSLIGDGIGDRYGGSDFRLTV